ncbi:MAG: hypothetical protein LBG06_11940 [Deltaproteobacteria bacterium]|jgi:hypothetical protein|nr:hypothetical protein [Deltaproteobacteria bacterium]
MRTGLREFITGRAPGAEALYPDDEGVLYHQFPDGIVIAAKREGAPAGADAGEPLGVAFTAPLPAVAVPLFNTRKGAAIPPGGNADLETDTRLNSTSDRLTSFGFAPRPFPGGSAALSWSAREWLFLDGAGREEWETRRRGAVWKGAGGGRWLHMALGIPGGRLGVGVFSRRGPGGPDLTVEPGAFLGWVFAAPKGDAGGLEAAAGIITGLARDLAAREAGDA